MKLTRYIPERELGLWGGYNPWRELRAVEETFERMLGGLVAGRPERETILRWEPAVDVYEKDKEFVLKAELPEVDQKDVHVNVEGNVLTVTGERRRDHEVKEGQYHRTERLYGKFTRAFALPDTVDREGIKATFKDGVMTLALPKKELAKPREIPIEIEKK